MNLEDNKKEIDRAIKLNIEYEKQRQKKIKKVLLWTKLKWLLFKLKGDI